MEKNSWIKKVQHLAKNNSSIHYVIHWFDVQHFVFGQEKSQMMQSLVSSGQNEIIGKSYALWGELDVWVMTEKSSADGAWNCMARGECFIGSYYFRLWRQWLSVLSSSNKYIGEEQNAPTQRQCFNWLDEYMSANLYFVFMNVESENDAIIWTWNEYFCSGSTHLKSVEI